MGIEWHVLADGDEAGKSYAENARHYISGENSDERLTVLKQKDIERCFWSQGYKGVYERHARLPENKLQRFSPGKIIQTAVRKQSKPFLALGVVEAIASEDSPGIPAVLQEMIRELRPPGANCTPSRLA